MSSKVMKIAISIPEPAFREVEKVCKQTGLSRSAVFVRAVQGWLRARNTPARSVVREEELAYGVMASESALRKDWLRPEEDEAWADL